MTDNEKSAQLTFRQVSHRIVTYAGAGLLGTSIVFITTITTIDAHPLDQPLQHALIVFAAALPMLLLSSVLAFFRFGLILSYWLLIAGGLAIEYGEYQVILHTDILSSEVFSIVCLLSNFSLLMILSWSARQARR